MVFGSEGIGVSVIWIVSHCVLHVYVRFLPSPAPGTPPRNIQAKGLSDRSFGATWLPPSQPNGYISAYRLYYVTDPKLKIDRWFFSATGFNETEVTGLRKMTTYYFRVVAYNSAGIGPFSDLFAVKTAKGGEWSLARRRGTPPLGGTQEVGVRLLAGGERYPQGKVSCLTRQGLTRRSDLDPESDKTMKMPQRLLNMRSFRRFALTL